MNRHASKKPDWAEIRARYESSGESLRHMAQRFDVPFDTIKKRSSREKWLKGQDSEMAPSPENWTSNGTVADLAAKNGTTQMAPPPKNGTNLDASADLAAKNGSTGDSSVAESGSNNGTTTDPAAKSGTAEMAPVPENGSNNGTTTDPAAENGTTEMAPVPENGSTGGSKRRTFAIPADINSLDRLAAAQFYFGTLGWAVHPLYGPDRGEPRERGKKPTHKSWREHTAADITREDLAKCFAPGTRDNIGCVVRPPFVHVDLDSKPDAGASVMQWLATMSELAAVLRIRQRQLYTWRMQGVIPFIRIGRSIRYRLRDLDAAIDAHPVTAWRTQPPAYKRCRTDRI